MKEFHILPRLWVGCDQPLTLELQVAKSLVQWVCYTGVPLCSIRVLPTLVWSGQLQPLLSNFYHHSGLFYHHPQRVKGAEMLCLVQFDSTLAKVQPPLRLSWGEPHDMIIVSSIHTYINALISQFWPICSVGTISLKIIGNTLYTWHCVT